MGASELSMNVCDASERVCEAVQRERGERVRRRRSRGEGVKSTHVRQREGR